ncbi:ciliary neurotrophic factor [Tiliqua scincoides]|uniref:ciliary neurotrophic factor n=1 Tax=Tiliqua scincoides TaxID=71010 RepID=UPI003461F2E1
MASAKWPAGTSHHRDLCCRSIHLLRKMRSDVSSLLESYAQKQGLDKNINLDSVDGVPTASIEQHWSEISDAERLADNLKAYRAFEFLLNEILEAQKSDLTPTDGAFHESIHSVILQVSALSYQLEQLMVTLGHSVPARELEGTREISKRASFEQKVRGMKVLQELAHWAVRSVRDLHLMSRPVKTEEGAIPNVSYCMAQAQKK